MKAPGPLVLMILAALTAALPSGRCGAEEVVLADGGRAFMPVIIADDATERQRELADELAALLEEMSGAQFEVAVGDGLTGIILGTPDQFPVPGWREALAIHGHDGREAYGVRTGAERVLVIGATDLGLDRGITRLLEELGCRWFFPGEAWRIIPHRRRLAVDLDLTDRPAMYSRVIWWDWGPWDQRARADWERWQRRNRLGGSLQVRAGHSWQRIIRENRQAFDEHPEYLALTPHTDEETGETTLTRDGHKLCISNPEVVELCRRWALDYFAANPDEDMVSMEPSDGSGHCECADCRAMGSVPERVHWLTNTVARAVAERYPGKLVGTLAYNLHSEPPSFHMEPNVYVQVTAGFTRGRYSFDELVELWAEHASNLGVYEYLNVWAWSRDLPGASRGANVEYLAERIPWYAQHGVTTMSCESGANYGPDGLGYLVASHLMWNPQADVLAIRDDFYRRAYGPAAEPMRRYWERFDGGGKPLVSDHLLALQYADVAEASALAADRPDVLRRLEDAKLYLHYVGIMRALDLPQDEQERLDTVFALLNFAWRTRHRYVVHSTGIRGRYATYYLGSIEEPENWSWAKHREDAAWCTGEDYTADEVEALFAEDMAHYAVQEFEERTFSDDLVPVGAPPMPGGPRARQIFQGARDIIWLSEGEPIRFRLLTGYIAHYRDRRPTEWQVLGADGDTIAGGKLPLDGEWHDIEVTVPAAGRYTVHVADFGAGWQLDYAPGTHAVMPLLRGVTIYPLGGSTGAQYFYVPPGTKRIAYYVRGGAHQVLDGDGNLVAEIAAQPGNVVTIDVPEGQAGRVWCLANLMWRQLWLFNCPPYVATLAEDIVAPVETMPN